jgi:hypothetical protein
VESVFRVYSLSPETSVSLVSSKNDPVLNEIQNLVYWTHLDA